MGELSLRAQDRVWERKRDGDRWRGREGKCIGGRENLRGRIRIMNILLS